MEFYNFNDIINIFLKFEISTRYFLKGGKSKHSAKNLKFENKNEKL